MKAVLQQTSNRKSSTFSLKAVLKPGDWKKKRLELVLEALMRAPPLGLEVQVRLIQKLLLTAGSAEGSCVILWHLVTSRRASPAPHVRSRVTPQPQDWFFISGAKQATTLDSASLQRFIKALACNATLRFTATNWRQMLLRGHSGCIECKCADPRDHWLSPMCVDVRASECVCFFFFK